MIRDHGLVTPIHEARGRYHPCERARAEEFIAKEADPTKWRLEPFLTCVVCSSNGCNGTDRCYKHRDHTPCSIDGCTKGRKFADGVYGPGTWNCGIHWRLVCPPRSPLRRTYNRFFRIARKLGVAKERWPDELERRYWRFFAGMIARHHRGLVGYINVDEINKLFGWDA